MKKFALSALLALFVFPLISQSAIIYGSGQGVSPTNAYTIDPHWVVVALPVSYTNETVPFSAYNPAISSIPGVFAGRNGYVNNGVTNYWLAPNTTTASMQGGNYSWIVAQTFVIPVAYEYNFLFQGAGDNAISFYINGSITGTNTENPGITNGTKIGGTWNDFGSIGTFKGTAFLNAGTNTAYMVLNDFGGNTGALITQSSFSIVPEPGTWAGAALLVGAAGYVRWRKRAKVS